MRNRKNKEYEEYERQEAQAKERIRREAATLMNRPDDRSASRRHTGYYPSPLAGLMQQKQWHFLKSINIPRFRKNAKDGHPAEGKSRIGNSPAAAYILFFQNAPTFTAPGRNQLKVHKDPHDVQATS